MNIADLTKNFHIDLLDNTPPEHEDYADIKHASSRSAIGAFLSIHKNSSPVYIICSNQDGIDYLASIINLYQISIPETMHFATSLEEIPPQACMINVTSYY